MPIIEKRVSGESTMALMEQVADRVRRSSLVEYVLLVSLLVILCALGLSLL